jgi:hypothetical protein
VEGKLIIGLALAVECPEERPRTSKVSRRSDLSTVRHFLIEGSLAGHPLKSTKPFFSVDALTEFSLSNMFLESLSCAL